MSKATIPLAKTYANKPPLVGLLSEKFDGVPIKFTMLPNNVLFSETRAGKSVGASVDHIRSDLREIMEVGDTVVMEVFAPGKAFKDSSGMVRKNAPCPVLIGGIFDVWRGPTGWQFPLGARLARLGPKYEGIGLNFFIVQQYEVNDAEGIDQAKAAITAKTPTPSDIFEGYVLRDALGESKPGARIGYWRITEDPTVDLMAIGMYQAIDKNGTPKDMLGGLLVRRLDGTLNKISAGKMKHAERVELWKNRCVLRMGEPVAGETGQFIYHSFGNDVLTDEFEPKYLMQAKYKRDPSYDLLRQATFQHWRTDKDEPSED